MSESVVLGGGCFWCTEAAFKQLDGVERVTSGYAGGDTDNPSYREVCSGNTGHAEVVRIEFDPEKVSFKEILKVFFKIHDPTTRDREGPDVGRHYRSIILYTNDDQRTRVEEFIERKQRDFEDEIVTEVEELETFYPAEEKHQDYFEKNPEDAYCRIHVAPKVEKAKENT